MRAALLSAHEIKALGSFRVPRAVEPTDWLDSLPRIVGPTIQIRHPPQNDDLCEGPDTMKA